MANVFRSKEVYKKIGKHDNIYGIDIIVPVGEHDHPGGGMYVTGEYRPPYYTDGLTLESISSTPATITPLITIDGRSLSPTTVVFGFTSDLCDWDVERYETDHASEYSDISITLFGFTSDPCDWNVERYGRDFYDTYTDISMVTFGFEYGLNDIDPVHNPTLNLNNQPEPAITLEGISSDPATIVNG